MNRQGRRMAAVAAVVVFVAQLAAGQSEPQYKELPNFHKVNERLYRGAQPGSAGIRKLVELGIKTIVNLRGEDESARAEQREAEAAGLRYYSISMPGLSRPTDAQVNKVLTVIDAPENAPVFIHCKRGSDRTGTIVALYRITHDSWTDQRAIEEARRFGMSWVEIGMRNYIEESYRRFKSSVKAAAVTSSN